MTSYVISDPHFNHESILDFEPCRKEFLGVTTVEEMNFALVERINSVVKPDDKLYLLGDIVFGEKTEELKKLLRSINGKKRFVLGNHDNAFQLSHIFGTQKIDLWKKIKPLKLVLTHVPVDVSVLKENRFNGEEWINIHGHIHSKKSPTEKHKCVCVEHTKGFPIDLEQLKEWQATT